MPENPNEVVYYRVTTDKYRTPVGSSTRQTPSSSGYENYQFIDHYVVTGYRWLRDSKTREAFNSTIDQASYRSSPGSTPEVWGPIPSPGADPINYGIRELVDTYPDTYQGSPRTVRVHHTGGGALAYEYDNPLHISIGASDIQAVGATVNGTTRPGQVTVHVATVDGNAPPIDNNVSIFGAVFPKGATPPAASSSEWKEFVIGGDYYTAPFLREATGIFPVDRADNYTCGVRILYGAQPSVYPDLTKDFVVSQAVAAVGTLELSRPQPDSTATELGKATGIIPVELKMTGPSVLVAVVELRQDGRLVRNTTVENTHPAGNNPPYKTQFEGLPAGLYTLSTFLSNNFTITDTLDVEVLPPALEIGDQLTFLPWVQPTLSNGALMQPPAGAASSLRPTLQLSATLVVDASAQNPQPIASTIAEIYGPGDVLGLNQRAILATVPMPDAVGFSPLQLAAIDFKEEDLPWRYSMLTASAVAATANTAAVAAAPLPWCMLLVMRTDEFESLPLSGQPLPSINVKANAATRVYPSSLPQQQKLWAHVQVNKSLGIPASGSPPAGPPALPTGPQINGFLNGDLLRQPDLAYSRVLCPRRLEADTAYQAFLVPALEAGRLAGLGLPFTAADVRASAIPGTSATTDVTFPVYFQWKFATGSEEDFESLVAQLHPANGATGTATAPGLGVQTATSTYVLPMPALLVDAAAPPAPAAAAAQELAVAQYLHAQLVPGRRVGSRPVVTPPLYGRAYMVTPALLPPTVAIATSWKHTLNLDPRYRALAALGAQVVQDNQEEYVRRAWEQVQDILLANDKLRGAQYGLRTTTGLRDQHLPLETTAKAAAGGRLSGTASRLAAPSAARSSSFAAATTAGAASAASPGAGMADYGLHLTGLALSRIRISDATRAAAAAATPPALLDKVTVREAIRRSSTPLAAFSPTFRRIMKPFGNYQVGEAGRPLRPTQPAPPMVSGDLRQAGTSLSQRDAVLSQLVGGQLTAAPERAEQVRAYQFLDDKVDALLAINGRTLSAPSLSGDANGRFGLAFARFRTRNSDPTVPVGPGYAVHFHKPQYVRPDLPLAAIKADVVVGTQPGPVFQVRTKQASPVVDVPPAVAAGDYDDPDFNANDFYVGDFGEPGALVPGDWLAADFAASDFQVDDYLPAAAPAPDPAPTTFARSVVAATAPATPAPPAGLPIIKQAKVTPVFKDPMGEALRLRHPELFVPGLGEFPAGGVAVLDVNRAFMEAYMVGLNHALGSELRWRGFPVDVRGTFFQQFWDVSEHFNTTLAPGQAPSAAEEAAMLDIAPLDQWIGRALGSNAPDLSITNPPGLPARVANPLRLAVRSELLRRYPNLVLALQSNTDPMADPANMLHPLQRLAVGQDVVVVTFDVEQATAKTDHNLVLMERPGQPKFGLDEFALPADKHVSPTDSTQIIIDNPLSWNDFSWEYLGTKPGAIVSISPSGRPHATAEPGPVAYLTDSATVAYALFQEPIMATIPLSGLVD